MSTPVRASDRDLRALAAIVSEDRTDLPDGEGLPPSLLADLMAQIRCDALALDSWDSGRQSVLVQPGNPVRRRRHRIGRPLIRCSGKTTGTASTAATLPAPATCAAS